MSKQIKVRDEVWERLGAIKGGCGFGEYIERLLRVEERVYVVSVPGVVGDYLEQVSRENNVVVEVVIQDALGHYLRDRVKVVDVNSEIGKDVYREDWENDN